MMEFVVAAGAGILAGGALLLGALIAWFFDVNIKVVASIMAFGAGVLIATLSFDLVTEAIELSGIWPTISGFAVGALAYVGINYLLDKYNVRNKRRKHENAGTGSGIAVGTLLDGVPESLVLGLSMVAGQGVSIPVLVAVLISNIPEGLSSTAHFKNSGRSGRFIFWLWGSVTLIFGISSLVGYTILADASPDITGFVIALAAGAILAMVSDTMIPEAYKTEHNLTGLLATLGFLCSLTLSELV